MSKHRREGPATRPYLGLHWLNYAIERAGLIGSAYGVPGRMTDVFPLPPIRHAIEAGPAVQADVIIHAPPSRQCLLCEAEKCWRIVRSGDHAVSWACSEHLSPALDSLIWPGRDGRTVFTVVH